MKPKILFSFRISRDLLIDLNRAAKARKINRSRMIENALIVFIRREKKRLKVIS